MKKKLRDLVPPWTDGMAHLQICLAALICGSTMQNSPSI